MNGLMFLLGLLSLISADILLGIVIFIFYKYMDLKYFNQSLTEDTEKTEHKSFWG